MQKEGGVEVLDYREDFPMPELKPGEILIENVYAGVNYIDTYVSSPSLHLSLHN